MSEALGEWTHVWVQFSPSCPVMACVQFMTECSVFSSLMFALSLSSHFLSSRLLLSAFISSPLLCGPVVIILWPLCFTVMSPHLRLIVSPSQFLTQNIFNTFFLLAFNLSPHSFFLSRQAHFSPTTFYQYFHSFPFFPDVIAFDYRNTSTVPLPSCLSNGEAFCEGRLLLAGEIRRFLEMFVLLLCGGWQMFARVNSLCVRVRACLSEGSCLRKSVCMRVCVGVHRFMGPPVKWNWERFFFLLYKPCCPSKTDRQESSHFFPPTLYLDLPFLFLSLIHSFSLLSVFPTRLWEILKLFLSSQKSQW